MSEQKNGHARKSVRIGLLSRIDYGSKGWRTGLVHKAAERFHDADVDLVILVGGLVGNRAVNIKKRQLEKTSALLTRQLKSAGKQLGALEQVIAEYVGVKMSPAAEGRLKKLQLKRDDLKKRYDSYRKELRDNARQQKSLLPENMAEDLAKKLPAFTNAKGERVKFYILPSPAYDGEDGTNTARLLVKKLFKTDSLRLLKSGADRLPLRLPNSKTYFAELELLAPLRPNWRGDYFSTPVDRMIKDKRKQTSLPNAPDITVVGGFGTTITKPRGESTVPFVALPVLHRIEDEDKPTSENQIGVVVMEVFPKVSVPVVHSHTFKDLVSHEREFIVSPDKLTAHQERCIALMKVHGLRGTGWLADSTNLSHEQVMTALTPLLAKRNDRPRKSWPGLSYDANSDSWDFSFSWVLEHLRYPDVSGERKVDTFVGFACLHAGSHDTDYGHFLREVPKVILERNATILIGAGDFVEGQAHGMMMRQELVAGMNEDDQQEQAGRMIAQVMFTTFKPRFEALVAEHDLVSLTPTMTAELVRDALITFMYIPGNHDLWDKYSAHDPMTHLIDQMNIRLNKAIEKFLRDKDLRIDSLSELVASKIMTSADGQFTLPSGLRMSIQHPQMARAKTKSLRPQEMLDFAPDCPVVVGANFHVGITLEQWESGIGQRFCIQIGTMKHGSPFEGGKLKTVDQGFVYARIESVNGKIVRTENTFISNEGVVQKRLDPKELIKLFNEKIGLTI